MEKEFYVGDVANYEVVTGKNWPVKVVEVKRAYGKIRYMVVPIGGGDMITTERLSEINNKQTNGRQLLGSHR